MTEHEERHETEANIERAGTNGDQAEEQEVHLDQEFREFGSQLLRAVRAVADSEELRRLGSEVADSLRDIGDELQHSYERTRHKEEVQAAGQQARRVTQAVTQELKSGELKRDIQGGLSQALRQLNSQLNRVIDQVQARSARSSQEIDGTAHESGEEEPGGTTGVEGPAQREGDEDTETREETKNQPHYLGDKVDDAVDRLEESGGSMSPEAESQLDEGRSELQDIVDTDDEDDEQK